MSKYSQTQEKRKGIENDKSPTDPGKSRRAFTMTELEKLFYSRSAAGRILNLPWWDVEVIEIGSDAILVETPQEQQYISKTAFHQDFVTYRQQQARSLRVRFDDKTWTIYNTENGHSITVSNIYEGHRPQCNCKDFEKHHKACKHIYAVLLTLGYNTLSEYLGSTAKAS